MQGPDTDLHAIAEAQAAGMERWLKENTAHAAVAQLDREKQADMRHMVKASLLVTTGLVPTALAVQTLVG